MKKYHSTKTVSEDAWQHDRIELLPLNPDYDPIPVAAHKGPEMVVVGESNGLSCMSDSPVISNNQMIFNPPFALSSNQNSRFFNPCEPLSCPMNNNDLNKRDICTKFISAALVEVGWAHPQFSEEVRLTKGRVMVWGKPADGNSKQKFLEGLHQDFFFSTTP